LHWILLRSHKYSAVCENELNRETAGDGVVAIVTGSGDSCNALLAAWWCCSLYCDVGCRRLSRETFFRLKSEHKKNHRLSRVAARRGVPEYTKGNKRNLIIVIGVFLGCSERLEVN